MEKNETLNVYLNIPRETHLYSQGKNLISSQINYTLYVSLPTPKLSSLALHISRMGQGRDAEHFTPNNALPSHLSRRFLNGTVKSTTVQKESQR